jgi:ribosomal protein S25
MPLRKVVDELKPRALEILKGVSSENAVGVAEIARQLNIAWTTAKILLLELELEKKIGCLRTPRGDMYYGRVGPE